jgi:hypothetical protein
VHEWFFRRVSVSPFPRVRSCGVAKLVRHRTVNAAMRRFESFRHSQIIADFRLPIANLPRRMILPTKETDRKLGIGNAVGPELERQSSGLLIRGVRV